MQIQPILAALRHHRLATLLIALEIALACAVLCNASFLVATRWRQAQVNSGVDEASLAVLALEGYDPARASDLNARVMAGLQAVRGLQSASAINAVPFGDHAGTAGITLDAAGEHFAGVVDFYVGAPGSFEALGLRVVAGAPPRGDAYQPMHDFVPADATVLVTQALADHLWPGLDPLGRAFWVGHFHFRVGGVLAHLVRPGGGEGGADTREWSVFVPAASGPKLSGVYLLRAPPERLSGVLRDARAAMAVVAPDAVVNVAASRTLGDLREAYFRQDQAMARLLLGVIAALLLVTALGIVGLASFWVQQRRRQIGVRRALGATRGDILRYFHTENFLIVSVGVVLGVAGAYALNVALMHRFELAHLPPAYPVAGAATLWLLGQLAVLGPALRAARVSPVEATRST
jgi:putative ABC transport system permease protein